MHAKKFHFDNLYLEEPRQYGAIRIYQIGDLYCNCGYKVAQHIQHCHEISYVVSGIGSFEKDGEFYRIKNGDMFLSPYNSKHTVVSSSYDPIRYCYCGFMFDKSHPNYAKYASLDKFLKTVKNPVVQDKNNIYNIFSAIFNEIIMDYDNKNGIIEDYLDLLLLLTERNYCQKGTFKDKTEKDSRSKNRMVYDVINYIDNNIFSIQNLTDISKHIGYSYSHTSQVFSSIMGMPLGSYYQKIRFEKAIKLIESNISITQVAEMLGFDSIHSFSRSFKKYFGISPTNYMEQHFEKKDTDVDKELTVIE